MKLSSTSSRPLSRRHISPTGDFCGIPQKKSESEKLAGINFFLNAERGNIFKVEKVARKNSLIWYNKDYDLIGVNTNHVNSNQLIPDYSTNIGSINDLANIREIEKMLSLSGKLKAATAHSSPMRSHTHTLPVYFIHTPYMVPTTQIFTFGEEPNYTMNLPADPDLDPSCQIFFRQIHLTHPI